MLKITGGIGGNINFICPAARTALKVEMPSQPISKTEVDLMYGVLMNTLTYSFEQ